MLSNRIGSLLNIVLFLCGRSIVVVVRWWLDGLSLVQRTRYEGVVGHVRSRRWGPRRCYCSIPSLISTLQRRRWFLRLERKKS